MKKLLLALLLLPMFASAVTPTRLMGKPINQAPPTDGQVVRYNDTSGKWEAGEGGTESQWVTNGSDIYYEDGKVGIGPSITTPAYQLHVRTADSGGGSGSETIALALDTTTFSDNSSVSLLWTANDDAVKLGKLSLYALGSAREFRFWVDNGGGTLVNRLTLKQDGTAQIPALGAGFMQTDASGNISSSSLPGPSLSTLSDGTALPATGLVSGEFKTFGTVTLTAGTWAITASAGVFNGNTGAPTTLQLCLSEISGNACSGPLAIHTLGLVTHNFPAPSTCGSLCWVDYIAIPNVLFTVGGSTAVYFNVQVTDSNIADDQVGGYIRAIKIAP